MKPDPSKFVPTASGGIARLAYQRAKQAGADADVLLREAGLTAQQISDERLRVAARTQIKLLNLVAEALQDDYLGIRLAQQAELRAMGLLYYVLASSGTLAEAFARASRYSTISNESIRIGYRRDGRDLISYQYVGIPRLSDRHQIELFVTLAVRLCRQLTGREIVPQAIKLMHGRSDLPPDLKSFFGCAIQFGASVDEVTLPRETGDIAIVSADPFLNSLLEKYCQEAIAARRTKSSDWRVSVENAMAQLLPHGQATLPEVSRRLAITPRTLARRLTTETTTFAGVLDSLRQDLATRYLRDSERSISEIAWLLGYQQTSSFDRAFRRWTGVSPGEARVKFQASASRSKRRLG
jgi:AraC-like DNA-binding protein